jgi:hypothetical protein
MIHNAVFTLEKALYDAGAALPIFVMAEPRYVDDVRAALKPTIATTVRLRDDSRGIGYSRYHAVKHAASQAFDSIAMVDDDEKIRGNVREWLELAEEDDVVGVGSFRSIYGLLYKDTDMVAAARKKQEHLFLHKGSAGYQSFALNVRNTLRAGNFDPGLRAFEDHELCRQGMRNLGLPWYIYTGVNGEDLVPRTQQTGERISQRGDGYHQAHGIVWNRWPGYISRPGKRYSCQWKKLVERYVHPCYWPLEDILTLNPFDWRAK